MKTLSLSGPGWTCSIRGESDPTPAIVPGCNYHDLLRAGKIDDPFYGVNEDKTQWVGEAGFDYARAFALAPEDLAADRIELHCAALDTLCHVYVNDLLVGEGKNAHIGYAFDVTRAVKAGENSLRVEFDSPAQYARAMAKQFTTAPDANFTGRTHIRKPQCHFGWDWGPCIPISGITGEIGLRFYRGAKLLPMEIAQKHGDGKVTLSVKARAEMLQPGVSLRIAILSPAGEMLAQGDGDTLEATIEQPEFWWTNDLSDRDEQPLYTVKIEALHDGQCVDVMTKKIGLRTIELNREADAYGRNFQFVLNGVPVFAKGANWIPPDAFPDRAEAQGVRRILLAQCVEANMNMVRVWGGGCYETDEFYDLCDSMGLLVWQDFAFACAPYPFDRGDFLQNVKDEIEYNVARLRHRASLALWCGNNELESSAILWLPYRKLQAEQGKFFWGTLPGWVKGLDAQTPFISTSPTGGAFMKGVESDGEGDTHIWHVWHGMQGLPYFRKRLTRFCSEFGQQSFPDMRTVRSFAGEGEPKLSDAAMKSHQKCISGNQKILYYIAANYRLPKNFNDLVYLSQITQADCVAYATEHWRRNRGRCNGSLYWQLNDNWPVTSWSSIDYAGRAKALQYYARRFNEPVCVSIDDDRGVTKLYVHNDMREARRLNLEQQLMDFDGRVLYAHERPVEAPALSAVAVADLTGHERGPGLVLRARLKDGGEVVSQRTLLFGKEKNLDLPQCEFASSVEVKGDAAYVTIRSDRFARAVLIESDLLEGNFSDNFMDVFPGEPVTVTVGANGADAGAIRASLRFACVNNVEAHGPAGSALRRLGAMAPPAHLPSWVLFKMRKKMP